MSESKSFEQECLPDTIMQFVYRWRGSRKLVVIIVAIGLLLDNMLLTTVVPIMPKILLNIHGEEYIARLNASEPNAIRSYQAKTLPAKEEESPILISPPPPSFDSPDSSDGGENVKIGENCSCSSPHKSWQLGRKSRIQITTPSSITASAEVEEVTTMSPEDEQKLHEDLVRESTEVGILFASKPVIQALANPFIGPLTNRIGYSIPMFFGFVILFVSSLTFGLAESSATLFIARVLQGVGSSCTSVAGLGMIADRFGDDEERGKFMGFALGGVALGVLIGPPYGGLMYKYFGQPAPFLFLAFLAVFDGMLQMFVLQPKVTPESQEGASFFALIKDPYVAIAAGAITIANTGIGVLEPSLPLWMMDTMKSDTNETGMAFLPASISYLIGTNIFGPLGNKMGRWLSSMIALIGIGFALLSIPSAHELNQLIIPNAVIGFAIGMVDSSMMPMLGYLVDIRYTSTYGNVYAIGDVALCLGFILGPFLSGTLVRLLGFTGLVTVAALLCFLYAPLLLILRKPPRINEDQALIGDKTVKYVNYTGDSTPEEETSNKRDGHLPAVP